MMNMNQSTLFLVATAMTGWSFVSSAVDEWRDQTVKERFQEEFLVPGRGGEAAPVFHGARELPSKSGKKSASGGKKSSRRCELPEDVQEFAPGEACSFDAPVYTVLLEDFDVIEFLGFEAPTGFVETGYDSKRIYFTVDPDTFCTIKSYEKFPGIYTDILYVNDAGDALNAVYSGTFVLVFAEVGFNGDLPTPGLYNFRDASVKGVSDLESFNYTVVDGDVVSICDAINPYY